MDTGTWTSIGRPRNGIKLETCFYYPADKSVWIMTPSNITNYILKICYLIIDQNPVSRVHANKWHNVVQINQNESKPLRQRHCKGFLL